MNTAQDATLEISYPKALLVSVIGFVCFFVALFRIMDIPTSDPLLVGFRIFTGNCDAVCFRCGRLCFMLRCRIGHDGLRRGCCCDILSAIVLRWEDMSAVWGFGSPFYSVDVPPFSCTRCYESMGWVMVSAVGCWSGGTQRPERKQHSCDANSAGVW